MIINNLIELLDKKNPEIIRSNLKVLLNKSPGKDDKK